jgi:hypothetical protein
MSNARTPKTVLDAPTLTPVPVSVQTDIGTVHLRFVHVTDTAMAAHRAKMAYAATMPASA